MRTIRRYVMAVGLMCAAAVGQSPTPSPTDSRQRLITRVAESVAAFDRGTELLRSDPDQATAEFGRARDGFEALAAAGVRNGPLYYNLGNTYLRLGELGRSLANYRIAERYTPGDEMLRANLRFARSLRRDQIQSGGKETFARTLFFVHYTTAPTTRFALALCAYGLVWLLLLSRSILGRRRLGYAAAAAGLICVSLTVSLAISGPLDGAPTEGVLVTDEIVVRKGNGEGYAPQFEEPLHEGVEFTVVERRNGWIHIELPDGNRGWIREHDAVLF